jgi:MbtH protein
MAEIFYLYKVVINNEEQYSIWPKDKTNPSGWHDADKIGTKEECLNYIQQIWGDMRPLSLRRQMESWQPRRSLDVKKFQRGVNASDE